MIIENNLRNEMSNNLIIQFYFKLNFFESIFFFIKIYINALNVLKKIYVMYYIQI